MIIEYIRYTIQEERTHAFAEAYRRAADALEASEHCERYEISRCTEDPTQHVVRIEWIRKTGTCRAFAKARSSAASSKPLAPSCTTSRRCGTTRSRSRARRG
jgi:heme-degrading monooxygenase HmoA